MIFEVDERNIRLLVDDWKRAAKRTAEKTIEKAIKEPRDWDNNFGTTVRRNRDVVVGNNRDIFDLGNFANSWNLQWLGNKLQFTSSSPYSSYIIMGYVTRSGTQIKGRVPWENLMDELEMGGLVT